MTAFSIRSAVLLLAAGALSLSASAATPADTVFTSYGFGNDFTNVNIGLCTVPCMSNGFILGANLDPMGRVGAIVEGPVTVDEANSTNTRFIYAIDQAYNGTGVVKLIVYRLVVTAIGNTIGDSLARIKTITLPLKGGPNAKTFMAANNKFLYVGTDQSTTAYSIAKVGYGVSALQTSFLLPTFAITKSSQGFVTVLSGTASQLAGWAYFDADGHQIGSGQSGAGGPYFVNTGEALLTYGAFPGAAASSMPVRRASGTAATSH